MPVPDQNNQEVVQGMAYLPTVAERPTDEHEKYVLKLLIKSAECFGYHLKGAKECASCPVALFCLERQAEVLETLATRLDREVEINKRFTELEKSLTEGGAGLETALRELTDLVQESSGGEEVVAPLKIVCPTHTYCFVCNRVLGPGEKCLWLPRKGPFHITCQP